MLRRHGAGDGHVKLFGDGIGKLYSLDKLAATRLD
jgi:hypothetical protein